MIVVRLPFGFLILTSLYLLFCFLISFYVPVDCLDEPCNTENEVDDNSILAWATHFLTALSMFIFAVHLQCFGEGPVYRSAVLAQCSMAVAQVTLGLERLLDTEGQIVDEALPCILRIPALAFMTLSAFQVNQFAQHQSCSLACLDAPRTLLCTLLIALLLLILAWAISTSGYIWRIIELQVNHAQIDTVGTEDTSLQLARAGETAWCIAYSLLWIPVSVLLRRVILQHAVLTESGKPKVVCGLSTGLACIGIAILPWTIGTMLPVWLDIASTILNVQLADLYNVTYGAAICNYGVLLSFFLFHNLAGALQEHHNPQLHIGSSGGCECKVDEEQARGMDKGDETSNDTDPQEESICNDNDDNSSDSNDSDRNDEYAERNGHLNWLF